MAEKHRLALHAIYSATIFKPKLPGKFPCAYVKVGGRFVKPVVFVSGDDSLQVGQDVKISITKIMPTFAFGTILSVSAKGDIRNV